MTTWVQRSAFGTRTELSTARSMQALCVKQSWHSSHHRHAPRFLQESHSTVCYTFAKCKVTNKTKLHLKLCSQKNDLSRYHKGPAVHLATESCQSLSILSRVAGRIENTYRSTTESCSMNLPMTNIYQLTCLFSLVLNGPYAHCTTSQAAAYTYTSSNMEVCIY